MKRIIALALAVLLLCGAASALAEEYYNIVELRQQTPERLTKSYETKWRTVEIDAPIYLPTIDKLPALTLRTMPSYEISLEEGENNAWPPEDYASFAIEKNWESKFAMVPKGMTVDRQSWDGVFPENNQYTLQEAVAFAKQLLQRFTTLNPDKDIALIDHPQTTGAYYLFDFNTGEIAEGHIALEPTPTAVEKGSYLFKLKQCFHDAIFYGKGFIYRDYVSNEPIPFASDMPIKLEIVDSEHYLFLVFVLQEEVELLADDIPLIGFDKVLDTIESYIKDGHIHSISSIKLCDLCAYASPDKDDPLTYAIPCWWVSGVWKDSPKANITGQELNELMFCINAQTGEAYDPYDTSKNRTRLKQLITWDQVTK